MCTEHALAPDTKAVILETWLSVLRAVAQSRSQAEEAHMRWWA